MTLCEGCLYPLIAGDTIAGPSRTNPCLCVSCDDVGLQECADAEQGTRRRLEDFNRRVMDALDNPARTPRPTATRTRRRAPSGHKVLIRGVRGAWLVGCVGCGVIDSARTMRDARAIQRDHWEANR